MLDFIQRYYGETPTSSEDLKTSACCTATTPPAHIREALAKIHDEVCARYCGCGLVVPEAVEGCKVLDLGCGSGRDCYLLSQLVGRDGYVVGVDMTEAQLDPAARHRAYHAERFGYAHWNVEFHQGYIEQLDGLPLAPESFDIVV
jgi:arsenite methyltransferase